MRPGVRWGLCIAGVGIVTLGFAGEGRGEFFKQAARIVFEAEAGKTTPPFEVIAEPKASGGKVAFIKDKANQFKAPGQVFYPGTIEYTFDVAKEADYVLWLRKLWMDACGNSIYVSIDQPITDEKKAFTLGEDGTYSSLGWISLNSNDKDRPGPMRFRLTKGKHVLRVQNREDGIKLDEFALLEYEPDVGPDRQYVPVSEEPPTQTLVP